MQVVTFSALPKTKPPEYIPTALGMFRYVRDHKPSFKEWKRYLRERDLYDKENFDVLMRFLGLRAGKGKGVKIVTDFLSSLAEEESLEAQKKALFRHLARKNEILVKYVMDGLAERLYSTNELYRYITSYVYPGDYITLLNFKAWVEWLQATGHIKMIGIRWGLSDLGEEAMNYVKTIDVEDILEEEEDELDEDAWEEEEEEEEEDIGTPADSAAPRLEKKTPDEKDEASQADAEGAEAPQATSGQEPAAPPADVAGRPAAQAPVATPRRAEPRAVTPDDVETVQVVVQPFAPQPDETSLKLVQDAFQAADEEEDVDAMGEPVSALGARLDALRLDEDIVAENLRALLSWWHGGARGRILRSTDYGFDKDAFEEDLAFNVYRLTCLAVSLFRYRGQLAVGKGGEAFGMLDQMGFFTNAFKSRKSIDKTLDELFKGGLAQRPDVFSNLHWYLLLRRALKDLGKDGLAEIPEAGAADLVLGKLWQHLGHFSLSYEVLWVARELHLLGVWDEAGLDEVLVVPLPRARENAFRLGFIETPFAADFPSMAATSRRLTRFFGEKEGLEAPLMYFEPSRADRHYGKAESVFFTRDEMSL